MSLSLTQLLVHRLDVINLLKEASLPAVNCLHRCHSIPPSLPSVWTWPSVKRHTRFFSQTLSFVTPFFARHINLLSPSLSVTPPDIAPHAPVSLGGFSSRMNFLCVPHMSPPSSEVDKRGRNKLGIHERGAK